jgi:hypothetical protein
MLNFSEFNEAVYAGNVGVMELIQFHKKATPAQKKQLQSHIQNKKHKEFRDLIQNVTGVKLHKSVNEKQEFVSKAGAGEDGRPELTIKYAKDTPGQWDAIKFKDYIKNKDQDNLRKLVADVTGVKLHKIMKEEIQQKITLSKDPKNYGAIGVEKYKSKGPTVNIPTHKTVGFEPDDKMHRPENKAKMHAIVKSIKSGKQTEPILARKHKDGYQVIDGHHRFHAHRLVGSKTIPAKIVPPEHISEESKSDLLPVSGAGREETDTLRKKYQQDTPGQKMKK